MVTLDIDLVADVAGSTAKAVAQSSGLGTLRLTVSSSSKFATSRLDSEGSSVAKGGGTAADGERAAA